MSHSPTQMRHFAERLIAYDARGIQSTPEKPVGFPVLAKLRHYLAALMGNMGFRSLLMRALLLARVEVSVLRRLKVTATGVVDELEARADTKEIAEGRVVLVAHLLGLLVALIGEVLVLRLIREIWPRLPLKVYKEMPNENKN